MLTTIFRWLGTVTGGIYPKQGQAPVIVARAHHQVSRANISKAALKVLYRLRDAGFEAYLVGGGVRDVLLGRHPKDFDLATNAKPEQVQKLFQNCRLIGRRFRLAHVHFGSHIIEVATFRANASKPDVGNAQLVHSEQGMILRDNIYGTLEEDVFRRDFTVNALYYTISDFSIIDYVGGLQDLEARCLRMIGDARQRYREDPVRMLRAVRFAAKLGFSIHPDTEAPIFELGALVQQVPSARLLDEYVKLFLSGHAQESFRLLRHYQFFALLFPDIEACLQGENGRVIQAFIQGALHDTDQRMSEQKPVSLAFLLAAFLWCPAEQHAKHLMQKGLPEIPAFYEACDLILHKQQQSMAISRRLLQGIRDIWTLQMRLGKRIGKRAIQLYANPGFRAAYDFLLLRASMGEKSVLELATWWTNYIAADEETRALMSNSVKREGSHRRKRKKRV